MLATELIESLERQVNEFGDGEVVTPEPLEGWWLKVETVEFDYGNQRHKLLPEGV